jgi:hypothetical protein
MHKPIYVGHVPLELQVPRSYGPSHLMYVYDCILVTIFLALHSLWMTRSCVYVSMVVSTLLSVFDLWSR